MLGKLTAGGRQQAIAGIVGDGPVGRGDGIGYGWGGDHEVGPGGPAGFAAETKQLKQAFQSSVYSRLPACTIRKLNPIR
jgi:hypothetical protein